MFIYYWVFITVFQSRFPIAPQRSVDCRAGWGGVWVGRDAPPPQEPQPTSQQLAEATAWGVGVGRGALPELCFSSEASLKGRQSLNRITSNI